MHRGKIDDVGKLQLPAPLNFLAHDAAVYDQTPR